MRRVLLLIALSVSACTDEDRTIETLQKSGFKDIKTGGYAWTACSDSDTYATEFTATNPAGQRVNGVVCCGYWKNCTVRF